jgi:DNA-binding NarL/FixJ family response regulator
MKQYCIAIVDDHNLIARALSTMIEGMDDFTVVFEAENGQKLMELMKNPNNRPDIVLLDISMPRMDGFTTAAWLTEQHPEILVMALTTNSDDDCIIRMIKNGARGYLPKTIQPHELEKALRHLVQEGYFYTGEVMRALAGGVARVNKTFEELSERDNQLLQLLCTEMQYKEIGERLFLSTRTVEGYAATLMEKLEVKTRIGLVLLAARKGWLK